MPDELELLETLLSSKLESVYDTLNSDDMINVEKLIGQAEGLEYALEAVEEIRKQIKNFEDTVSGTGG